MPSLYNTLSSGKKLPESQLLKRREKEEKMIYRKWSLLTGPVAILGSVVGSVVVAHFLLAENNQLPKPEKRNANTQPRSK